MVEITVRNKETAAPPRARGRAELARSSETPLASSAFASLSVPVSATTLTQYCVRNICERNIAPRCGIASLHPCGPCERRAASIEPNPTCDSLWGIVFLAYDHHSRDRIIRGIAISRTQYRPRFWGPTLRRSLSAALRASRSFDRVESRLRMMILLSVF